MWSSPLWETLLEEALTIQDLAEQPKIPWSIRECLGREATVPKNDYQFKEGTQTSTPRGAFGIIEEDVKDLTFWTPWDSEAGLPELAKERKALQGQDSALAELRRRDNEWKLLLRGECCGLRAEIVLVEEDGMKRAKIQCLGAAEGSPCRLDGPFHVQKLFVRSVCKAGFECKPSPKADINGVDGFSIDGFGVCQPETWP